MNSTPTPLQHIGLVSSSADIASNISSSPSIHNSRNAGRKKTNPVWDFFTDLKNKGLPGVRCRYCEWITNDRSPTTLKFHLKRRHDTGPGGIWAIVEERINLHIPHNYKATRAPSNNASATTHLSASVCLSHHSYSRFSVLTFRLCSKRYYLPKFPVYLSFCLKS
ncbi:hypothetical protein AB6A40_011456 [Gnathostoma spinigerum]|uniref:BED-type domain-containing protein n=1 Tax=Gnathostoma spinigerum TaxID=75299 RepID=A0ABD6EZX6_9BILA